MKSLYIIKTGDAPAELLPAWGDFEDHFLNALNLPPDAARLVNLPLGGSLPALDAAAGIVITGSLSNVTENLAWMQKALPWVQKAAASPVPMMGVCFGHQLIARAHGARVDFNPGGPEYGTVEIELTEAGFSDALLAGLSSPFNAQASHSQSVLSLPKGAVLLANNPYDGFHALRYGKNTWTFQFHPEWDADLMGDVIEINRTWLKKAGQDPDFLLEMIEETPGSSAIMDRFAAMVSEHLVFF